MRFYDCLVHLTDANGVTLTEVPKMKVSAAEVLMLQHIHGVDKVTGIADRGDDKVVHSQLRDQLGKTYGDKNVFELFGPGHRELPQRLADQTDEGDNVDDSAPKPAAPLRGGKKARGVPEKVDAESIVQ